MNCFISVTKLSLKHISNNCIFELFYIYKYFIKDLILHYEEERHSNSIS
jgi:hypothetical protein